jgi:hypothetical protein
MGPQVRYNVETMDGSTEQQPTSAQSETQHEPHPHAPKRLIIGVLAVIVVFVLGGIIWSRWGNQIERICFGEESCDVEPVGEYVEGTLQYDTSAFDNVSGQ